MKKILLVIIICVSFLNVLSQNAIISIIPKPSSVEISSEEALYNHNLKLYTNNKKCIYSASMFIDFFEDRNGKKITFDEKKQKDISYISLLLTDTTDWCEKEGYHLEILKNEIKIIAKETTGIFYGLQSLQQIFMHAQSTDDQKNTFSLPLCVIHDRPRFSWRGMNLDCCRHFMEKNFIKRYIDLLAFHKMNVFHWHLTEDQGWRIEIKKYPKLTEIGAWRTNEDGKKYGGFYTQNDIREIVDYAASRHITVVPEIEMPGHSLGALTAYPHLSCTGGPFKVENRWGVFKDIYCAGNDSIFIFMKNILTEVMELFPSEYIHIGGDEAPKYRWENCPKCQKRIKDENLANEHELQSWFIREIEKFLNQNGRRLIGWDEILEGGLAPSATVQSWRGFEGAYEAARSNHNAIVSPTSHCYFDYDLASTNLEKVYSFEPVPENLPTNKHKYILGGECNMWTERTPQNLVDKKVFPRICAISEVLWTPKENKSFQSFHKRMNKHYTLLDQFNVNYGFENQPVTIEIETDILGAQVSMKTGQDGLDIYYTLDGTEPTENSKKYSNSFSINQSFVLKALASNKNQKSKIYSRELTIHKAFCHTYQTDKEYSETYPSARDKALLDGVRGTDHFRDNIWQGYRGVDLSVQIPMEKMTQISTVSVGFLQSSLSWIFYPEKMEVFVSKDEKNWIKTGEYVNTWSQKDEEMVHADFTVRFKPQKVAAVKVLITNMKKCPDWHPGAGSKTWMFIDEIIIE